MTIRLTVGSKSALKLAAVRNAVQTTGRRAGVVGVDTESGVHAQPLESETETGARNRARFAQLTDPGSWAVGIENGLFRSGDAWLDRAVIVLRAPDGREWVRLSDPVTFPEAAVEEARRRGFDKNTAGSVLAEQTGCDPQDPHATLTEGRTTRQHILVAALIRLFQEALPR